MASRKKPAAPFVLPDALMTAFATNNRINLYLIEHLPEPAWRAVPPGGNGRTIAAMAAHIHNVRLMWLKSVSYASAPSKLNPESVTRPQAAAALSESGEAIDAVLRSGFGGDGRIKGFQPDAAGFFAYLIAHDAHHRGQIMMMARQSGHPVSQSAMFGLWQWGTR